MAAPVPSTPRPLVVTILALTALLPSCEDPQAALAPQIEQLKTELETTRRKLANAEKSLTAKDDQLVLAAATFETAKAGLAEKTQALTASEAQLRGVQTEIAALKKRDAFVFAEIRTLQQQGGSTIALSRYQQFLRDYPASPLAANATAAIAELTAQTQRDTQRFADATDPKRRERELLNLFRDGLLTPKELAPLIKKKSRTQVLALLGQPDRVFPDGTEIGYTDKITNPATNRKGTLIITFEGSTVAALRVDYAGPKMVP